MNIIKKGHMTFFYYIFSDIFKIKGEINMSHNIMHSVYPETKKKLTYKFKSASI